MSIIKMLTLFKFTAYIQSLRTLFSLLKCSEECWTFIVTFQLSEKNDLERKEAFKLLWEEFKRFEIADHIAPQSSRMSKNKTEKPWQSIFVGCLVLL